MRQHMIPKFFRRRHRSGWKIEARGGFPFRSPADLISQCAASRHWGNLFQGMAGMFGCETKILRELQR